MTFIIAGKVRETTDTVVYGRMLFFIAGSTLLIISFLAGDSIFYISLNHIPWILFLGFVPSILGHNMLNYALKYTSPTSIASLPLGEPILASIFGLLIFNEMVPFGAIAGGPIILIGVYLILKDQHLNSA